MLSNFRCIFILVLEVTAGKKLSDRDGLHMITTDACCARSIEDQIMPAVHAMLELLHYPF